jgi:hypothetical protein
VSALTDSGLELDGEVGGAQLLAGSGVGEGVCDAGMDPPSQAASGALPVPPGWFPRTPFNDSRIFRGGRVSPYGANLLVVLYRRTSASDGAATSPCRPR